MTVKDALGRLRTLGDLERLETGRWRDGDGTVMERSRSRDKNADSAVF